MDLYSYKKIILEENLNIPPKVEDIKKTTLTEKRRPRNVHSIPMDNSNTVQDFEDQEQKLWASLKEWVEKLENNQFEETYNKLKVDFVKSKNELITHFQW